ncbi:MAG: hypothetical protein AAFX05_11275 [Planctomycetota bacterium]
MTTCCPNCSTGVALGGDIASVCTECATVTVAGASYSPSMMMLAVAGAVAIALAGQSLRRVLRQSPRLAPAAA